jgi:hypothetical protein
MTKSALVGGQYLYISVNTASPTRNAGRIFSDIPEIETVYKNYTMYMPAGQLLLVSTVGCSPPMPFQQFSVQLAGPPL